MTDTRFHDILSLLKAADVEFTLEKRIHLKRAAGRPEDFESVAELEILLEERARPS